MTDFAALLLAVSLTGTMLTTAAVWLIARGYIRITRPAQPRTKEHQS